MGGEGDFTPIAHKNGGGREGPDFGKEVEARGDAQREEFSDGLRIGFLKPATGNEVDDANGVVEPQKHRDENSRS